MVNVKFGERTTYDFFNEDGTPSPIVDFAYFQAPTIVEKSGLKDVMNKEVLMTLHGDNSLALTTIETGERLLWYDFHESHVSEEDAIVDILPGS